MSDEQQQEQAETKTPKKKKPIILVAAVAVLMVVEGVGVFLFVKMTGPSSASGAEIVQGDAEDEMDKPVEMLLVQDKFQNMDRGRVWSWEVEVWLKVKARNKERVEADLKARSAEIRQGIGQIVRKAEHAQLKEPGLQTLHRQVTAFVNTIFGTDADGLPRVDKVLIPVARGTPRDF